jgi:sugar phosphate isomerase/epimerase
MLPPTNHIHPPSQAMPSRRQFHVQTALAAATSTVSRPTAWAASEPLPARRFTLDLTPGAIGVGGSLTDHLKLAHAHGFESVQPEVGFLSRLDADAMAQLKEERERLGLRWGSAGLPVNFRQAEDTFKADLERLPAMAQALQQAGATRIGTWISPGHPQLEYAANFELHVTRLKAVSQVLHDHGLRFGLEYVGTPSLVARSRFPFVRRLSEARQLIAGIGVPGTGLILDSWHWWTAGDSVEALAQLTNDDIVAVDLNDAPTGLTLDQQQDNRRELPAATGVIPVRPFLEVLLKLNYDGPVRAEPFNGPLNELNDSDASARTIAALRKAVRLVLPEA